MPTPWVLVTPGLYRHDSKPFIIENNVLRHADRIPALDYSDLTSYPFITHGSPLYAEFAYTQPSGTNGGDATPNTWQDYPLNTELSNDSPSDYIFDPITGIFTLSPGNYQIIDCRAISYKVNNWLTRIYDIDGASEFVRGFVEYCDKVAGSSTIHCHLRLINFTVPATNNYKMQYLCSAGNLSGTDLGIAIGATNPEQYGYLKLAKVG